MTVLKKVIWKQLKTKTEFCVCDLCERENALMLKEQPRFRLTTFIQSEKHVMYTAVGM